MVLEQVPTQVLGPSAVDIRGRQEGAVAVRDKRLAPVVEGRMDKPGHPLEVGREEDNQQSHLEARDSKSEADRWRSHLGLNWHQTS